VIAISVANANIIRCNHLLRVKRSFRDANPNVDARIASVVCLRTREYVSLNGFSIPALLSDPWKKTSTVD